MSRQFWQQDLSGKVAAILAEHALPPGLVGFELSESTLLDKPLQVAAILHQLRDLGGEITIDDFGTGYAFLSYLEELPVTTLKIDRRFIQRLDGEQLAVPPSWQPSVAWPGSWGCGWSPSGWRPRRSRMRCCATT